uniref:Uncharacterized protein n=1 Tax=Chromera velia CCMP2878 TaxID=1169474 RepID=A0A0G4G913_9ALVE|eukprot:Cvel_4374.t1-p1 / transcript=Cvel_4374.t1 / gene=Cvel_4374 / organism=Chromera_velia_CCMP2878 / gene_product=hypothetical protein / transcript_product=hypothetical protein / location=Cvel_scaffold189:100034-102061(+) / protein_length=676 / sequence_SO=supercontig / SO=protein_coding / is_pseudo=false
MPGASRRPCSEAAECCFKGCVLAPIGILKGLLLGTPNAVGATLAVTLIFLLSLPRTIFLAVKVVWSTAYLGSNLRCLLLLILPLVVGVIMVAVPTISFLVSFFGSVFFIGATVFTKHPPRSRPEAGGTTASVFKSTWDLVYKYFKWQLRGGGITEAANELCGIPRGWDGRVYEIPFWKLAAGFGVILWGLVCGVLVVPFVTLIKTPLFFFRANELYCKTTPPLYCCLFWLLGWALMNVVALPVLIVVVPLIAILALGPCSAAVALKVNDMREGLRHTWRLLREFDERTNELVNCCGFKGSCLPKIPEHPRLRESYDDLSRTPQYAVEGGGFERVWAGFLRSVRSDAENALARKWVKESDVSDLEPFLAVGLPALSIFEVLLRSSVERPGERELVCLLREPPLGSKESKDSVSHSESNETSSSAPEEMGDEEDRQQTSTQRVSTSNGFDLVTRSENVGDGVAVTGQPDSDSEADLEVGRESVGVLDVVSESSRPRDSISNRFWPKLMNAKEALEGLRLTKEEEVWCRVELLAGGAEEGERTEAAKTVLQGEGRISGARLQSIKRGLLSHITGLAIDCSRLARAREVYEAAKSCIPKTPEPGPVKKGIQAEALQETAPSHLSEAGRVSGATGGVSGVTTDLGSGPQVGPESDAERAVSNLLWPEQQLSSRPSFNDQTT